MFENGFHAGQSLKGIVTKLSRNYGFIRPANHSKDFYFRPLALTNDSIIEGDKVDFTLRETGFNGNNRYEAREISYSDVPQNRKGIYSVICALAEKMKGVEMKPLPGFKDVYAGKHLKTEGRFIRFYGMWNRLTTQNRIYHNVIEHFLEPDTPEFEFLIKKRNIRYIEEISKDEYEELLEKKNPKPEPFDPPGLTRIPSDNKFRFKHRILLGINPL